MTGGLALGLAALHVHFKDVKDLLANLLALLFFLTPILYPLAAIELPALTYVVRVSPMTPFALGYQELLFHGRLPGPWLTLRALDAAMAMASTQGTGTVVIRRSHHIACLEAYLKRATDRGMMALVYSSDPVAASVAPFGAVSAVFTPNPLAAGIPTSGDPILIDVSASYTTNSLTTRLHKAGGRLPHAWVQDAQ
ncbi:MAG: Ldh family oxidoreductase, partial [Thermoanaerobaculia bacterium]|nr:Ldh family oxidoreductase [Thermoanaerobaculia bacterium]